MIFPLTLCRSKHSKDPDCSFVRSLCGEISFMPFLSLPFAKYQLIVTRGLGFITSCCSATSEHCSFPERCLQSNITFHFLSLCILAKPHAAQLAALCQRDLLLLLHSVFLLHAGVSVGGAGSAGVLEIVLFGAILLTWAVNPFFVLDHLWIDGFELGLETGVPGSDCGAVGAAAWFRWVVVVVFELRDALAAPRK